MARATPVDRRQDPRFLRMRPQRDSLRHRAKQQLATFQRETVSFFQGFNTSKAFVAFGFTTAVALGLLFGLDILFGWPFMRASLLYSGTTVLCAAVLGYLSWDVARDQRRR